MESTWAFVQKSRVSRVRRAHVSLQRVSWLVVEARLPTRGGPVEHPPQCIGRGAFNLLIGIETLQGADWNDTTWKLGLKCEVGLRCLGDVGALKVVPRAKGRVEGRSGLATVTVSTRPP